MAKSVGCAAPHANSASPIKPKSAKGWSDDIPARAKAKQKPETRQGKHFGMKAKKRKIKP
jgi:hypothetical protein